MEDNKKITACFSGHRKISQYDILVVIKGIVDAVNMNKIILSYNKIATQIDKIIFELKDESPIVAITLETVSDNTYYFLTNNEFESAVKSLTDMSNLMFELKAAGFITTEQAEDLIADVVNYKRNKILPRLELAKDDEQELHR